MARTHVVNVRLEAASSSEDWSGQRPMFSAEIIAYGTALMPNAPDAASRLPVVAALSRSARQR